MRLVSEHVLLEPLTDQARAWVEEQVRANVTRFGPAILIDKLTADVISQYRDQRFAAGSKSRKGADVSRGR